MRSAASRRGLALLALVFVMGGCSSATKKHYLKHLSTSISPVMVESETVVAANPGASAVAAANPNGGSRP
jgi:hypothetical protein